MGPINDVEIVDERLNDDEEYKPPSGAQSSHQSTPRRSPSPVESATKPAASETEPPLNEEQSRASSPDLGAFNFEDDFGLCVISFVERKQMLQRISAPGYWPLTETKSKFDILNGTVSSYNFCLGRLEKDYKAPVFISVLTACQEEDDIFQLMGFLDQAHNLLRISEHLLEEKDDAHQFFSDIFFLGPYGVHPIVEMLARLDRLFDKHKSDLSQELYASSYRLLVAKSKTLEYLVDTCFKTISPIKFAPPGFQDLFEMLRVRSSLNKFPMANIGNGYSIIQHNPCHPGVYPAEFFMGRLRSDFGCVTDTSKIKMSSMRISEYGLDGFARIMWEFLTTADIDEVHLELFLKLSTLCGLLARRISNIKKDWTPMIRAMKAHLKPETRKSSRAPSAPPAASDSSRPTRSGRSTKSPSAPPDTSRRSLGPYSFVPTEEERSKFSNSGKPPPKSRPEPKRRERPPGWKPLPPLPKPRPPQIDSVDQRFTFLESLIQDRDKTYLDVLSGILHHFPHPANPMTHTQLLAFGSLTNRWKAVAFLYHPDKNPNISENNRALLLRVSQLLGLLKTFSVALGGTGSSTVLHSFLLETDKIVKDAQFIVDSLPNVEPFSIQRSLRLLHAADHILINMSDPLTSSEDIDQYRKILADVSTPLQAFQDEPPPPRCEGS
ncbi:hypothetical protein C8J56DRAFT_1042517 [Mycena floridula]|nr:hypothetical protein C8J56DRAFT_1042517 [Mycena floridula]